MARPNDLEPAADSVESLKRRFIRQNRELARVNATQAVQIRTLELEISRLLAENITLREKAIHDDTEIQRLREKVDPDSTQKPANGEDEEQIAFIRERREIPPATVLSPIVEDEEKSPVRLRSPITITRFRRPMRPRVGRRKSASLSEIQNTVAEPQSPSIELDFAILSPDSPARPASPIISPARISSPLLRSPLSRSPKRSIHIFQSESPLLRQPPPSKHPTGITHKFSPHTPSTLQSPRRTTILQQLSPNKDHRSLPQSQKKSRMVSAATPSPSKVLTPLSTASGSSKVDHMDEQSGQENTTHSRRRRDSKVVSYTEPSLRKKMRRQSSTLLDAAAEGSMVK